MLLIRSLCHSTIIVEVMLEANGNKWVLVLLFQLCVGVGGLRATPRDVR